MAIAAPPLLLTIRVCAALVVPTGWAAKLRLAGLVANAGGSNPIPESETVCVRSKSLMVKTPVWVPASVGTNTTLIEQLDLPGNCVPQLFEI